MDVSDTYYCYVAYPKLVIFSLTGTRLVLINFRKKKFFLGKIKMEK